MLLHRLQHSGRHLLLLPAGRTEIVLQQAAGHLSVKAVLRESVQFAETGACCSKSTTSMATAEQTEQDDELRVSGCPCGPGAPDASFVCADPRLAIEPVTVVGTLRIAMGSALQSFVAPRNVLEPLTPPPRALA